MSRIGQQVVALSFNLDGFAALGRLVNYHYSIVYQLDRKLKKQT